MRRQAQEVRGATGGDEPVTPAGAAAPADTAAPNDAAQAEGPEAEPADPAAGDSPSSDGAQPADAPVSEPGLASDPGDPIDARAVQRGGRPGSVAGSGPSHPGAPPDPGAATTHEVPPAGGPAAGDSATTSGSWKPDILDADNQTRVLDLETGAVEPDARTISRREPRSAPPHTGEAPTGEDHNPLPQPQPPPEGSL
jgi:hypothetical protein